MEHHFNEVKPIDYNRLFNGIRSFKTNEYILHKQLFEELRDVQNPHTLFIGCSDSRVVPSLLTRTLPGELFVVRNIGNFVPYFNNKIDAFLATSSVIEYAVLKLKVDVIVVCGHSNCGGCDALYHEEDMEDLPFTRKWLQLAKPIKKIIEDKIEKNEITLQQRSFFTEQMNIVEQISHLKTFPYIRQRVAENKLMIMGWYYQIETGEVFNYDQERKMFLKIE